MRPKAHPPYPGTWVPALELVQELRERNHLVIAQRAARTSDSEDCYVVVVPAKTDTPGAGFSHAVSVNAVAAAIPTIEAIRRPLRTGDDGEGMVGHYPDAVPASG